MGMNIFDSAGEGKLDPIAVVLDPEGGMDPGIVRAVKVLVEYGIETFESCEGGQGHSMPEPTVRFCGPQEAGGRALSVCLAHGLPVLSLRRYWTIEDGEPVGPSWELVFRRRLLD